MKSFTDFENYMKTDGKIAHDEIIKKVNAIVEKADIKDEIEEHIFYNRAFSEVSTMEILKHYHEWVNKK